MNKKYIKYIQKYFQDDFIYLIVEGNIDIKTVYFDILDCLRSKGLLLIKGDNEDITKTNLEKQMAEIKYHQLNSFFWIPKNEVEFIFSKTDFGESLDSCFFLDKKPKKINTPNNSGNFKLKLLDKIVNSIAVDDMHFDDLFLSYVKIPDLLILSKNLEIVNSIERSLKNNHIIKLN